MSVEFCDSNVVVYANDASATEKHQRAIALLQRLWRSQTGALSVQVLQETYVILTRKMALPLSVGEARRVIGELTTWRVVEPAGSDVLDAIDAAVRWQISFWDAMLLTTARKAGATILWSEDLTDGQEYDGVIVQNPFKVQQEPPTPAR